MRNLLVLGLLCMGFVVASLSGASADSALLDSGGNRVLVGVTNTDTRYAPLLGYQVVRVNDASKQLSLGVGPYVAFATSPKTNGWSAGPMVSVGVNRLWCGMGVDLHHKVRAQYAAGVSLRF